MPSPRKRRPAATTPQAVPTGTVPIGFSPEARAVFDQLTPKERGGLRRKLADFAGNPSIGKPLVGELRGFRRVTYGRMRTIARAELIVKATADGVVVVFVLHIGLRAQGSRKDAYALASEALSRGDEEAYELMNRIVRELVDGDLVDETEGE